MDYFDILNAQVFSIKKSVEITNNGKISLIKLRRSIYNFKRASFRKEKINKIFNI